MKCWQYVLCGDSNKTLENAPISVDAEFKNKLIDTYPKTLKTNLGDYGDGGNKFKSTHPDIIINL
jgi:hypothetical protein